MSKMIQIRNVPDELHRKLKERAARSGKTLSGLLLEELQYIAKQPELGEWLEMVATREPVKLPVSAAELIRQERDAY